MAVSIVDYFLFMQWRLLSLDGVEIDKLRLLLPSWTTMGVLERGDFRFHYAHHNVAYSLDYFDSLSQNFEMPVFQHSSVFPDLNTIKKISRASLATSKWTSSRRRQIITILIKVWFWPEKVQPISRLYTVIKWGSLGVLLETTPQIPAGAREAVIPSRFLSPPNIFMKVNVSLPVNHDSDKKFSALQSLRGGNKTNGQYANRNILLQMDDCPGHHNTAVG